MRIAFIAEERFDSSRFIKKRQRSGYVSTQKIRQILRVSARLIRYAGKRVTFLLRFNDSDRLSVDQKKIITTPFL